MRYRPRHQQAGASRASTSTWVPVLAGLCAVLLVIGVLTVVGGRGGVLARGTLPADPTAAASTVPTVPGDPSRSTRMEAEQRITGEISPKSVAANGQGQVIANNMMYRHTSTLYDAETLELEATVPDAVELADFGIEGRPGTSEGAPVEAVWTPDGRYAYVSQYQLTGEGGGASGTDDCAAGDAIGRSAVFRLDASTGAWDQVIEVGRVPKFISLSPDGSTALVSNWCDETVSVIDLATAQEVRTIAVDAAPRGSVILGDNRTAYVTAMYADEVYRVDLVDGTSEVVLETGDKPRHLVLSPDGERMYLTVSGADLLLEMDPATGEVLREMTTGREPRSMAISADGTALYIVNYYEDTVSKVDTETLAEVQRESTGVRPIGVTYEPTQRRVWVANYSGSIDVFDDNLPATPETDGG